MKRSAARSPVASARPTAGRAPTRATPPRRQPRFALIWIALGLAALAVLLSALWQTPSTLVSASLHTESVRFRVTSLESARIAFPKGLLRLSKGNEICVENLLVEPALGASISYTRPSHQSLEVTVSGLVTLTSDAKGKELPEKVRGVTIKVHDAVGCADQPVQRLPVLGDQAIFGAHALELTSPHDASLRILSGRLTVYGRALSTVLGIPLSTSSGRNELYVAGEIPLPGGSVIEEPEVAKTPESAKRRSAMWSGFADVDFTNKGPAAISVEVSTNASVVSIFLPTPNLGRAAHSGDPETVSLSLMARLTGDPHLLLLYGLLGVLALLLGLAATARELLLSDRKDAS